VGVKPPAEERSRDRVLSAEELRLVWLATERQDWPFGPFVKLLLLTAQRLNEVAGMRWSELDLDAAMWTLPAERAKNDKAHHVPLSVQAIALIRSLPRLDGTDFVFTTTGRTPISGFGRAKQRLDETVQTIRREEAEVAGESFDKAAAFPEWRFHDFRRTAVTGMAEMGIAPHVADRILNHVQGTIRGVAAVYNRHAYLDERRKALQDWPITSNGSSGVKPAKLKAMAWTRESGRRPDVGPLPRSGLMIYLRYRLRRAGAPARHGA
jgi:integrase